MKTMTLLAVMTGLLLTACNKANTEKIAELEKRIDRIEQALRPDMAKEDQRQKAKARVNKDKEIYSTEQQAEITFLYQTANRNWGGDEARDCVEKLIAKYPRSNRTGCALVYRGQWSEGEEAVKYLRMAIDRYSDCYFGDGVQVGSYGRYILAAFYRESGRREQAQVLEQEIVNQYPDAVDHQGRLLSETLLRGH